MKNKKRRVELVVVSDVHLGTRGCHAKELLQYLRSIKPGTLILNGDIVDIWQFSKRYWPNSHMKIVKHIIGLTTKGTRVYYVTGNHDETLRKFSGIQAGNLEIVNQVKLELDGKKTWIFHGDVFDVVMQYSKWLARIGAMGYGLLIFLNTFVNKISIFMGHGKISLSRRIKDNVKTAVKYINDFEQTAADLAIKKGFDYVVCGHIHHPDMRTVSDSKGNKIVYLNSGDWIENLSALEYHNRKWEIYKYAEDTELNPEDSDAEEFFRQDNDLNNKELFRIMLGEFQTLT
jgi:UDP-2,3-diacylglucosamine pyrophosphatase LpxH